MGNLNEPNVCKKGGRTYYRKKVGGRDFYIRLPDVTSPRFAEAYQRARGVAEREAPGAGTIAALVAEYRQSAEFLTVKSAATKRNYLYYFGLFVEAHGDKLVRALDVATVYRERDKFADRPGKANNWVARLNTLMKFAVRRGYRQTNPAQDVKPLPLGEREPWPADVLKLAMERAAPTTRLAIVTGLCSGARIGDAILMRHNWHDGSIMQFKTGKNKAEVAIPMHPLWLAEMARHERKAVTILYDRSGRPFRNPKALQERVRDLMKAIDHPGYTFHGLRKNAACYLAELGLSDTEIGSVCGMTPATVRHYTKRSRALMIARGAAERIVKGDVVPISGGRGNGRA